jgi:hypothetical protein
MSMNNIASIDTAGDRVYFSIVEIDTGEAAGRFVIFADDEQEIDGGVFSTTKAAKQYIAAAYSSSHWDLQWHI